MTVKGLAGKTSRAWRANDPGNEARAKPRSMNRSRRSGRRTREAEQSLFDRVPGVGEDDFGRTEDDDDLFTTCDDLDLLRLVQRF